MNLKTGVGMGRVFAALSLSLLIAACGSGQKEDIDLHGQLTTTNDSALADNSSVRISLVQQRSNDSERRIVAERTLHDLGQLPIKFDLMVGRGLLQKDARYGLSAEIHDSKGKVTWRTPVAQAVQPFADDRQAALLMLQENTSAERDKPITYHCADQFEFTATHDTEQATVRLGHRQLSLQARQAGKGEPTRYVDDHGNSLRLKKEEIALTVDDMTHEDCQVASEKDSAEPDSSGHDHSKESGDDNGNGASGTSSDHSTDTHTEASEAAQEA